MPQFAPLCAIIPQLTIAFPPVACLGNGDLARHERAGRYVFGIDVGVVDHDGEGQFDGGIARWLKLTDGLGLDRDYVTSLRGLLPGTRFAVDAYVHFLRVKTLLEAIAAPSWSASRCMETPWPKCLKRPNVRFGSLADIPQCNRHVRFTPRKRTFRRATEMSAKCQ